MNDDKAQAANEELSNAKVRVFSTESCPYCHMAKDYLSEQGVPFVDHNVQVDEAARNEMIQMTGQMGVPVIVVKGHEDKPMVGFNQERLAELIATPGAEMPAAA